MALIVQLGYIVVPASVISSLLEILNTVCRLEDRVSQMELQQAEDKLERALDEIVRLRLALEKGQKPSSANSP